MSFEYFKSEGEWLKGNLHSHTTNSDGSDTPQMLVDWYERNGYDFLAITDHNVITDTDALKSKMLLIPGIEFGYTPKESPGWVLDMLGINIRKIPEFLDLNGTGRVVYDTSVSPQQIIDYINENGGLAVMCHPYFMINMTEPYLKYRDYIGMEAYNYVCEELCGRGHHEIYWDTMLYRGKKLWGFATDDSHRPEYGRAWIEVKCKERTLPALIQAIRDGHFYATMGIRIFDVTLNDGMLRISFDRPCDVIVFPWPKTGWIQRSYENKFDLVDGRRRFYAEIPINTQGPYLRIELIDQDGKKAYVNPIYFD